MMEARERAPFEDNSHMFKKLASLHSPTYDGAPNPKAFKDWVRGMEKLFDALQCSEERRVGFTGFYLKDEANLWWATVRNRQYEPDFGWRNSRTRSRTIFTQYLLRRLRRMSSFVCNKGG